MLIYEISILDMSLIEAKKQNISLFIKRTPLVGDVAVSISFNAKLNGCTLASLKSGVSCSCTTTIKTKDKKGNEVEENVSCFPAGSEETCLCYAQYLVIQNALCGDPLATARTKVGSVDCGLNNGKFFICWRVKGTGSAVRKSLNFAIKSLNPAKYFSVYDYCVKSLGRKSNRDHFNYVADLLVSSIKSELCCGVVGNIKTGAPTKKGAGKKHSGQNKKSKSPSKKSKSKKMSIELPKETTPEPVSEIQKQNADINMEQDYSSTLSDNLENTALADIEPVRGGASNLAEAMLDVLYSKLKLTSSSKGQKPDEHINCEHSSSVELKVTGWHSYVVRDYINAKIKGMPSTFTNTGILLSVDPKKWETLSSKIKSSVKDYVKMKYEKVGSELANIVAYIVMSNAYVSCSDVKGILKNGLSIIDVEKIIKEAL